MDFPYRPSLIGTVGNATAGFENVLYASETCGACKEILTALDNHPHWAAVTEIVYVNREEGYARMRADGIHQTPELVTRSGQHINGPRASYIWLADTYGE